MIASPQDGKIHIAGNKGEVRFNFANSLGEIVLYEIDKNIFFDTDGNGIPNDDRDTEAYIPGTWKSNFEAIWGKTVIKLTVYDKDGNNDSILREIVFDTLGGANFFSDKNNVMAGMTVLIAFIVLASIIYKVISREPKENK